MQLIPSAGPAVPLSQVDLLPVIRFQHIACSHYDVAERTKSVGAGVRGTAGGVNRGSGGYAQPLVSPIDRDSVIFVYRVILLDIQVMCIPLPEYHIMIS